MEKVREEWNKTWQKLKLEYDKSVYEELSSAENQEFLKLLRKYIQKESLVLEAGCGYGIKCLLFNRYYKSNVIGLDIVLEPLKTLKDYLRKEPSTLIFVCCGDVTKLPFRNGVFDIITSFGVVEHFRSELEVYHALSEAGRILKKDGYLILTIPNFAATFRNKLVITFTGGSFGMYHKPYTRSSLINIFRKVKGLELVEIGFLPFGFRSLILSVVKTRSPEKIIYFIYHAVWHILNFILRIIADDYSNPIYLIAKVE